MITETAQTRQIDRGDRRFFEQAARVARDYTAYDFHPEPD